MQRNLFFLLLLPTLACTPELLEGPTDDPFEPNDSVDEAERIACGGSLEGIAGDPDWFTWETGQDAPLAVEIAWTDAEARLAVQLEGPAGALSCQGSGQAVNCSTDSAPAGAWQLGILPLDEARTAYDLELDCTALLGDDDDDLPQAPILLGTEPEDGQADWLTSAAFALHWDSPPEDLNLSLLDLDGGKLPLQAASFEGASASVAPVEPLQPSADYELRISWEGGAAELSFSTGPWGTPLADPAAIVGLTFDADLSTATWVEPPVFGELIAGQLSQTRLLMEVLPSSLLEAEAQPGLQVVLASGDAVGNQLLCEESLQPGFGDDGLLGTEDDSPGSFDNPQLTLGPFDGLVLHAKELPMRVGSVHLSGLYHPELQDIGGGVLDAVLDTRDLVPLLGDDEEDDAICQLLEETAEVSCIECGEPAPGEFCLPVRAEGILWEPSGSSLEVRSCSSILEDSACEASWGTWDADGDGTYELCQD